MQINILAVGDVCGDPGLEFLEKNLKQLQKEREIAFTVVNGENANVVGITPRQADAILRAGADVITLGNHTWTRTELQPYLAERSRILRPANYGPQYAAEIQEKIVLVDFHAEGTSEKLALGYLLDGKVSAVWGTHTHVQTSDACVLPKGTGYITDLGMTGAVRSVLGIDVDQSIGKFMGDPPRRYEAGKGPSKLEGCIFAVDTDTGRCLQAEAVRVT